MGNGVTRWGLLARGEQGLAATAAEVRAAGGTALPIVTDTAVPEQVFAAADRVEATLGPIDVWVNNAFASVFASFDQIRPAEYRRVTDVTYLGYVYGTVAALQHMKPRDHGTVVQVGSALAYRGIPLQSAYCGAKHAIQGFHESLRCELLHERSGVHVTMVQLPAVNTPQFSWVLSRLPRHAARCHRSTSPNWPRGASCTPLTTRSAANTGSGRAQATLAADAVAPGLLDRYLARTGFASQQTDPPREPDKPVNLWRAADGTGGRDFGAHGAFDRRAGRRDPQIWASHHHRLVAVTALGLVAVGAVMLRRMRR